MDESTSIKDLARRIRSNSLKMVSKANASHIGSCLSIADLLAVLYDSILQIRPSQPEWTGRDRFILSKGHAAAALYSVLAEKGFFSKEHLLEYCDNGSLLGGHVSYGVPGVDFSTGSLGHGLPVAVGMALGAKHENLPHRTFVILSDGELNEGSNWEAFLFAPQHHLDNLIVIIDYNKIQSLDKVSAVMELEPLKDKLISFRWAVREINGHNHQDILDTLSEAPFEKGKPCIIIAHTIKGKGISFMEDQLAWHYKSPNPEQLKQALHEIETNS